MIEILKPNAFEEAMLYYFGRANYDTVEKRFKRAIQQYPECANNLNKISKTATNLEKFLNSKLNVDNELVNKYFKRFNSEASMPPFASCLAFILMSPSIMEHIEYSADEMYDYFQQLSAEKRIETFYTGLIYKCETIDTNESKKDEITQRIQKLPVSVEDKWRILSSAFNHKTHIDELLSLLMPAAKLLEAASSKYEPIIDDFRKIYSGCDSQTIFEHHPELELKIEPMRTTKLAPLIFDFNHIFAMIRSEDGDENSENECCSPESVSMCIIFIGIASHMISKIPNSMVSDLSEKMKALSESIRLEMLFYLCSHRAYGQELCNKFDILHSSVTYHIGKLMNAGFITAEFSGGKTYYTANKATIHRMINSFAEKIK